MKLYCQLFWILFLTFFASCSNNDNSGLIPTENNQKIRYLALGDSYTIGQSVCETCRFPEQLKRQLEITLNANVTLKIIAQTGWTTGTLINEIVVENPSNDQDLVTLLIGVNNQYQNQPFAVYEQQFPELLNSAIFLAKGDKNRVIVVSIPDYAYSPFGQSGNNPGIISTEIDQYNAFAANLCQQNGVAFVNITDITREGIQNADLVASDGLHPSELAYAKFVERILPKAKLILEE
jgi:lysophospholipase L1-like esterase